MAIQPGDQVVVQAGPADPVILSLRSSAVVSRVTERGVYVTLDATMPPDEEFGPFPPARLRPWVREGQHR